MFFWSCEKDVLIQSKSGAVDNALHAQARGASGKYVQEKRVQSYLPLAQTGRSTVLNRGKKRKKMQKDKKKV